MSHLRASRNAGQAIAVGAVVVGALALGLGELLKAEAAEPARPVDDIDRMYLRCVEQMISETCRALGDTPRPPESDSEAPVFIAGIGKIDRRAYADLRSSGQAMCSTALAACRRDVTSPACNVAQQLWAWPGASR
jgi:hypothetical protein